MLTMYPGMVNSPVTTLANSIDDTQTVITVNSINSLPSAPNIATIGTDENAETILYTGKSGNDLTGVTRGFEGTAKSWPAETSIARLFTNYDWKAIRENFNEHVAESAPHQQQELLYLTDPGTGTTYKIGIDDTEQRMYYEEVTS